MAYLCTGSFGLGQYWVVQVRQTTSDISFGQSGLAMSRLYLIWDWLRLSWFVLCQEGALCLGLVQVVGFDINFQMKYCRF